MAEITNTEQIVITTDIETKKEATIPAPPLSEGKFRSENFIPRKTIVYETRVDPTVIRLAGEKIKQHLFTRFSLIGPKSEEIQFVSIHKYYQPYIVINGKYSIDYYRKCKYTIKVDDEVKEVVLFNNKFIPEHIEDSANFKLGHIKVEGEELISNEAKAFLILNDQCQDIPIKSLPAAASEKDPQELNEKNGLKEFEQDFDLNILQQRIAKRPDNINRIVNENLEVTERSIIYSPRYRLKYIHPKTGQERTVEFDGVTSQRI